MEWKFWRGRAGKASKASVTEVEEAPGSPAAEAAARIAAPGPAAEDYAGVDEDRPRLGGFHFEPEPEGGRDQAAMDGLTSRNPITPALGAADGSAADMGAVVRGKARRSRRSFDPIAAGVRPVLVPSLREMAVLYREAARQRSDNVGESAALWRAYLALCPQDGAGWIALGQVLLAGQQPEAAWGAFVEAHTQLPEDPLPAGALGYLSERAGDLSGAIAHYEAAVARAPDDPALLTELARLYGRAERPGDAQRIRERQVALQGGA